MASEDFLQRVKKEPGLLEDLDDDIDEFLDTLDNIPLEFDEVPDDNKTNDGNESDIVVIDDNSSDSVKDNCGVSDKTCNTDRLNGDNNSSNVNNSVKSTSSGKSRRTLNNKNGTKSDSSVVNSNNSFSTLDSDQIQLLNLKIPRIDVVDLNHQKLLQSDQKKKTLTNDKKDKQYDFASGGKGKKDIDTLSTKDKSVKGTKENKVLDRKSNDVKKIDDKSKAESCPEKSSTVNNDKKEAKNGKKGSDSRSKKVDDKSKKNNVDKTDLDKNKTIVNNTETKISKDLDIKISNEKKKVKGNKNENKTESILDESSSAISSKPVDEKKKNTSKKTEEKKQTTDSDKKKAALKQNESKGNTIKTVDSSSTSSSSSSKKADSSTKKVDSSTKKVDNSTKKVSNIGKKDNITDKKTDAVKQSEVKKTNEKSNKKVNDNSNLTKKVSEKDAKDGNSNQISHKKSDQIKRNSSLSTDGSTTDKKNDLKTSGNDKSTKKCAKAKIAIENVPGDDQKVHSLIKDPVINDSKNEQEVLISRHKEVKKISFQSDKLPKNNSKEKLNNEDRRENSCGSSNSKLDIFKENEAEKTVPKKLSTDSSAESNSATSSTIGQITNEIDLRSLQNDNVMQTRTDGSHSHNKDLNLSEVVNLSKEDDKKVSSTNCGIRVISIASESNFSKPVTNETVPNTKSNASGRPLISIDEYRRKSVSTAEECEDGECTSSDEEEFKQKYAKYAQKKEEKGDSNLWTRRPSSSVSTRRSFDSIVTSTPSVNTFNSSYLSTNVSSTLCNSSVTFPTKPVETIVISDSEVNSSDTSETPSVATINQRNNTGRNSSGTSSEDYKKIIVEEVKKQMKSIQASGIPPGQPKSALTGVDSAVTPVGNSVRSNLETVSNLPSTESDLKFPNDTLNQLVSYEDEVMRIEFEKCQDVNRGIEKSVEVLKEKCEVVDKKINNLMKNGSSGYKEKELTFYRDKKIEYVTKLHHELSKLFNNKNSFELKRKKHLKRLRDEKIKRLKPENHDKIIVKSYLDNKSNDNSANLFCNDGEKNGNIVEIKSGINKERSCEKETFNLNENKPKDSLLIERDKLSETVVETIVKKDGLARAIENVQKIVDSNTPIEKELMPCNADELAETVVESKELKAKVLIHVDRIDKAKIEDNSSITRTDILQSTINEIMLKSKLFDKHGDTKKSTNQETKLTVDPHKIVSPAVESFSRDWSQSNSNAASFKMTTGGDERKNEAVRNLQLLDKNTEVVDMSIDDDDNDDDEDEEDDELFPTLTSIIKNESKETTESLIKEFILSNMNLPDDDSNETTESIINELINANTNPPNPISEISDVTRPFENIKEPTPPPPPPPVISVVDLATDDDAEQPKKKESVNHNLSVKELIERLNKYKYNNENEINLQKQCSPVSSGDISPSICLEDYNKVTAAKHLKRKRTKSTDKKNRLHLTASEKKLMHMLAKQDKTNYELFKKFLWQNGKKMGKIHKKKKIKSTDSPPKSMKNKNSSSRERSGSQGRRKTGNISEDGKRSISPFDRKRVWNHKERKPVRSPTGRRLTRSPSDRRHSISSTERRFTRSPSDRKRTRSPSDRKRTRSPSDRKRSRSPSDRRRSRSPSERKLSRTDRRWSRSPPGRKCCRSPAERKRTRSPTGRSRSRSPRSPIYRLKKTPPLNYRRSPSPVLRYKNSSVREKLKVQHETAVKELCQQIYTDNRKSEHTEKLRREIYENDTYQYEKSSIRYYEPSRDSSSDLQTEVYITCPCAKLKKKRKHKKHHKREKKGKKH